MWLYSYYNMLVYCMLLCLGRDVVTFVLQHVGILHAIMLR